MPSYDLDKAIDDTLSYYLSYGNEDVSLIREAYNYAKKSHEGYVRKSGEPYITHPVAALQELMVIKPDRTTIIAMLLHDTPSHGKATLADIENTFGVEVRVIVEAIDKIGHMKYRGNKNTIEKMQKTLLGMAQDVRTIFVKFADRIHNLKTLQYHRDPVIARRIADETLSVYAPIATRLGLYAFKEPMETLSLRELDMDGYLRVVGELAHYTLEQEEFLTQSVQRVQSILPEEYAKNVSYRIKKPYSIYRKMKQYSVTSIRDLYDVFALRIVVPEVGDCYHVLGLIHGAFTPMIGRFKDFIAVPKLNGYQSLHTTVLGLYGHNKPTEIQIRTRTMDDDAERGTAAHILYKIHGDTASKKDAYEDFI